MAQMLLVDLLLHSWRTTDNLINWTSGAGGVEPVAGLLETAQQSFSNWGRTDPLYEWTIVAPSAPPPPP